MQSPQKVFSYILIVPHAGRIFLDHEHHQCLQFVTVHKFTQRFIAISEIFQYFDYRSDKTIVVDDLIFAKMKVQSPVFGVFHVEWKFGYDEKIVFKGFFETFPHLKRKSFFAEFSGTMWMEKAKNLLLLA